MICFWNYVAFIAFCEDVRANRLAFFWGNLRYSLLLLGRCVNCWCSGESGPCQFKFQEANTSPPSCPCWFAWSCSMPAGDIPELCLGIGGRIWALSASLCSEVKSEVNSCVFARLEDRREAWRGNTLPCRWRRKAANCSATSWFGEDAGRKNERNPSNSTIQSAQRDMIWYHLSLKRMTFFAAFATVNFQWEQFCMDAAVATMIFAENA